MIIFAIKSVLIDTLINRLS